MFFEGGPFLPRGAAGGAHAFVAQVGEQVFGPDDVPVAHGEGLLDDVFQFADVAGVFVEEQTVEDFGRERDFAAGLAGVFGQEVAGQWSLAPDFAGAVQNETTPRLLLIPASADAGKNFTLTYTAVDAVGGGYTNHASCPLTVLEGPRLVDFEGASFGYNTNEGATANLKGMNWTFLNVMTSDSTDRKIGATSARFKHTTVLAASMESQDPFPGVGTVSLNYAHYGTNRVVTFALQVRGEDQE